jgi:hypothetical protein
MTNTSAATIALRLLTDREAHEGTRAKAWRIAIHVLGATHDDLVNRPASFHGFDPGAPVKRHDNWRGTEQARKYISELLDKNGIH